MANRPLWIQLLLLALLRFSVFVKYIEFEPGGNSLLMQTYTPLLFSPNKYCNTEDLTMSDVILLPTFDFLLKRMPNAFSHYF